MVNLTLNPTQWNRERFVNFNYNSLDQTHQLKIQNPLFLTSFGRNPSSMSKIDTYFGVEMDGSEGQMHVPDGQPVYSHNVHYMQNHNLSNGNLMDRDEHHDNGGSEGGMEGDVLSDNHSALASQHESDNQLTLSFQGQVYVFDSVSPEKVQAVLLLLGDGGISPNIPTTPLTTHHNDRDLSSTPQRFDVPQRLASLNRFREKRKERNFDKKIRYTVRKEVALRLEAVCNDPGPRNIACKFSWVLGSWLANGYL
ncbi:hypothetical protein RJ639_021980 [Escallonia herrerae]|uniref:Uncharacterized protein n=1 Tax=Escallonia herrerae TaxID=1293975 RepID=A0AA89AFK9_9ASTE|nr:hypothetical protein RJ639_021980 [Escallonia herrerae]